MDWELAIGTDTLCAMILVLGVTGATPLAQLAVQTAEVRVDAPDAWQTVNSGVSQTGAGGTANPSVTVSSYTAGKMWVRWGIAFSINSGTAPTSADVTLSVGTVTKGMAVGSWRGQVATASTADTVVAVSGWVPIAWAQEVFAGILTNSAGTGQTFKSRLVYRTAVGSQDSPSAWTNTTDTGPTLGGNGARVAQDTTLAPSGVMWIQFGVAYWSTTGGTLSIADLAVSVAVRRT